MPFPPNSEPPPRDIVLEMLEPSQLNRPNDSAHGHLDGEDSQLLKTWQPEHLQSKGDSTVTKSARSSPLPPTLLPGENNNATEDKTAVDNGREANTSSSKPQNINTPNHIDSAPLQVTSKPPAAKAEREEKDNKATKLKSTDKNDGWPKVYNEYKTMDEEWLKKKNDHIDTLLVFAGLFSTVLTAFLVQVYTELHPDNTQLSVLLDLSNQLHAISLGQVAQASNSTYMPTDPSKSLVATTSLWFVSLILSLGSAFFGILVKQWLREYMVWTEVFPAHNAVHVRQYRHNDLKSWRVETIMMIISECLQLGLVLFFLGLATLLWQINKTVAMVATISVGLVLLSAATTAVLPAFLLSCPYRGRISFIFAWVVQDVPDHFSYILSRISVGVAAIPAGIRDSALSYLRDTPILLFYTIFNAVAATPGALQNSTRLLISHGSRAFKEYHKWLKKYPDSYPRVEDHRNWIEMDLSLRLPKQGSNGNLKRVLDMCTSLFWLLGHRDVPNAQNLVQQCLSDLQVPGVSLEPFKSSEGGLIAYGSDANQYYELQFHVYCQVLLGSIKSNYLAPEILEDCDDLQKFLDRVFPYRDSEVKTTIEHDSDSTSNSTTGGSIQVLAFDDDSITFLSQAIQYADRKSHGEISAYFISLANKLLNSKVFFSQKLALVAALFRVLFLLWYCSDYYLKQRVQGLSFNDTDTSSPQYQSYHLLQQAFIELLAQTPQTETEDYHGTAHQAHYDSIVDVLAFGTPVAFFDVQNIGTLDSRVVKNIMMSTVRFVRYYESQLQPVDKGVMMGDYNHRVRALEIVNVFWSMSNLVVRFDNQKDLNMPDEDHRTYLEAFQTIVEVASRYIGSTLDKEDVLYILRHRSHLPEKFVPTLQEAIKKNVLDGNMAIDVAREFATIEKIEAEQLTPLWEAFGGLGASYNSAHVSVDLE